MTMLIRWKYMLGFIWLSMLILAICVYASDEPKIDISGTVCITLFFSEDCKDCAYVKKELFPALNKKYPGILNVKSYSIDDLDGYDLLVSMEEQFGDMGNEIPVIFIGKDVLGGREEVVNNLEKLIDKYKSQGGCDFPQVTKAESKEAGTVSDKTMA